MYLYMGLIAIIPGIIYFTFFITRFLRNILGIHTNLLYSIIIGIIVAIISFPAMNTLELYGVVYYHLLVITVLFELLNIGLKRFSWYKFIFTSGILPIVVTVLFLGYGYYNINHVVATNYELSSDKIDDLKIIEIADLHMSTSINIDELKKYCDEMSELNADIVVLTGESAPPIPKTPYSWGGTVKALEQAARCCPPPFTFHTPRRWCGTGC